MSTHEGYLSEDTIAAMATPTGGAIAVLRLSGPLSFEIHEKLTQFSQKSKKLRQLVLHGIYSPEGQMFDQVLSACFAQPDSYSGEDLIEYHIHGNPWIAQRLLETLIHYGARQALPGEFSFRAVRNGKMNLFQAQAVADLIEASNDAAVTLALGKMSGTQTKLIEQVGHDLRDITALSEVGIDFADQDIDAVSLRRLKQRLQPIIDIIRKMEQSYSRGTQLQNGVRVAFVGLPNAGKSSFFNALLGEDRSIVSEIEGTTRDTIREKLNLRGKKTSVTLRLEDTAGLRTTLDRIEKVGIERTHEAIKNADLILFIVDPQSSQASLVEQWSSISEKLSNARTNPVIAILTKSDLNSEEIKKNTTQLLKTLGISTIVEVSSTNGEGLSLAAEAIADLCESTLHPHPNELLLTRLDHLQAVRDSLLHLERAIDAPEIDFFASDLRQSLSSLAPLIGDTLPDDILGKIFSNFCIGK